MQTITESSTGLKVNVDVTINYTTAAILGVTLFVAALAALVISNLITKNN